MESLKYIYVYSGKIEWAIFCHLNNIHPSIAPVVSPFLSNSVGITGFGMEFGNG